MGHLQGYDCAIVLDLIDQLGYGPLLEVEQHLLFEGGHHMVHGTGMCIVTFGEPQETFLEPMFPIDAHNDLPKRIFPVVIVQKETAPGPFGRGNQFVHGQGSEQLCQKCLGNLQGIGNGLGPQFFVGTAVDGQIYHGSYGIFPGICEHVVIFGWGHKTNKKIILLFIMTKIMLWFSATP